MRHGSRFLTLVAGLALAATSMACDGELSSFLPPDAVPLKTSTDAGVRAAGDSVDATEKIRKAEQLLQQGLDSKDLEKIKEAIRTRPQDASLYYYSAAMSVANNHVAEGQISFDDGDGIVMAKYGKDSGLYVPEAATLWLDALSVTMTKFPKDSAEWKRLNKNYCWELQLVVNLQVLKLNSIYPDDTCKKP